MEKATEFKSVANNTYFDEQTRAIQMMKVQEKKNANIERQPDLNMQVKFERIFCEIRGFGNSL